MSQGKGYIRLHRQIQDCWIWDTGKFDKRSAWIDLIMTANHKEVKILFDGKLQEIQRGQFVTSIKSLADRWGWSKSTVFEFLNVLVDDGMLLKESDNKRTLLTITNYDKYQITETVAESKSKANRKQIETNNTLDTLNTLDINIYGEKEKPQKRSKIFVPPTIDEVANYCKERGNYVSPESFVNYYESKGWMIGKNKMKDWKACVRTWEANDKKKGLIPQKDQKIREIRLAKQSEEDQKQYPYYGLPKEFFKGDTITSALAEPVKDIDTGQEYTPDDLVDLYYLRRGRALGDDKDLELR